MTDQELDHRIAESTWQDTDEAKNWVWEEGDKYMGERGFDIVTKKDYYKSEVFKNWMRAHAIPIPNLEQMLDMIEAKGWYPDLVTCPDEDEDIHYLLKYLDNSTLMRFNSPTRREAVWKAFCCRMNIKEK